MALTDQEKIQHLREAILSLISGMTSLFGTMTNVAYRGEHTSQEIEEISKGQRETMDAIRAALQKLDGV